MNSSAPTITQLLVKWSDGDPQALDQLTPLVYDELRQMARTYLRRERSDHTLQATALVHEAYLRIIDQDMPQRSANAGLLFLELKRFAADLPKIPDVDIRSGDSPSGSA